MKVGNLKRDNSGNNVPYETFTHTGFGTSILTTTNDPHSVFGNYYQYIIGEIIVDKTVDESEDSIKENSE